VDALIVQDFGVARLAQKIAPHLEIHASTQQTVTNTDGVMYAKERGGASRVVLGRELSLDEIRAVTRDLHALGEKQVEVETFVHGALCVSYSGQCFSSEAWGGRSANRGQCAQACRLPYGLIRNGELVDLQDMSYLLSPQDLCGIDQVEDLVRAGVSCLKIEGRLKDENYVAATTRAYRNAVDDAWDKIMKERGGDAESIASPRSRLLESNVTVSKLELAQLFSRGQDETNDGLTSGFFEGSQHQRLVRGRSPRHRGVHMGRVLEGSSPQNGLFILNDEARENGLKLGDGIVVDRGMPQEEELGGPIFDIQDMRDGSTRIRFSNVVHKEWKRKDDASRKGFGSRTPLAPPGAHVWKTSDASVEKKMRKLAEAPTPKIPVKVEVSGKVGSPLIIRVCDLTTGAVGIGESEGMLEHGNLKGMDEKAVRKAIGTLGNTSFTLLNNDSSVDLAGLDFKAWCPISWVKKARQQAIDNLTGSSDMTESIENKVLNTELDETKLHDVVASVIGEYSKVQNIVEKKTTSISVLARYQKQVEALCEMIKDGIGIDEIIIDFLEIEGISEAVATVRMLPESTKVLLATPRIIKPGEEGIWKTLLRLEPDGLLIRSAGLLHKLQKLGGYGAEVDVGTGKNVKIPELVGDFSLNAINVVTTRELIDFGGLSRITAGYDLNAKSITELAQIMNGAATQLEVIAHAHLPIFHTEHCVFARFLSKGNSYVDCGHVCTRNNVHLRDQTGKDNLVLADMGCRNTVFSAEAQSGVHSVKEWVDAGVGTLRIELVDEGQNDTKRIVQGYLDVINGKVKPSVVWETLKDIRDSNGRAGGVSHGSLRNNSERRAGEV
jgi:collagenase-like PrtC family protease